MIFTDEQLLVLKVRVEDYLANNKYQVTFNIEDIQGLIARLGAAERCVELLAIVDGGIEPSKELKAWRKAAGK